MIWFTFLGGGNKVIASTRLDWKASPKVGSTDNIHHKPGGGNFKVSKLVTPISKCCSVWLLQMLQFLH